MTPDPQPTRWEEQWTLHGIAFEDGSWAYSIDGPKITKSFKCEVVPLSEAEAKVGAARLAARLAGIERDEARERAERFHARAVERIEQLEGALEREWLGNHDERCSDMKDCGSYIQGKPCYHPRPPALASTPQPSEGEEGTQRARSDLDSTPPQE